MRRYKTYNEQEKDNIQFRTIIIQQLPFSLKLFLHHSSGTSSVPIYFPSFTFLDPHCFQRDLLVLKKNLSTKMGAVLWWRLWVEKLSIPCPLQLKTAARQRQKQVQDCGSGEGKVTLAASAPPMLRKENRALQQDMRNKTESEQGRITVKFACTIDRKGGIRDIDFKFHCWICEFASKPLPKIFWNQSVLLVEKSLGIECVR